MRHILHRAEGIWSYTHTHTHTHTHTPRPIVPYASANHTPFRVKLCNVSFLVSLDQLITVLKELMLDQVCSLEGNTGNAVTRPKFDGFCTFT